MYQFGRSICNVAGAEALLKGIELLEHLGWDAQGSQNILMIPKLFNALLCNQSCNSVDIKTEVLRGIPLKKGLIR